MKIDWRYAADRVLRLALGAVATLLTTTGRLMLLCGRHAQTLNTRRHPP